MIFIHKTLGRIVLVTSFNALFIDYEAQGCFGKVKTRKGVDARDVWSRDYELIGEL